MNLERLTAQLIAHEGCVLRPYTDTVGKLTIGIGRNLTDKGISRAEAETLLASDIDECVADLTSAFPWFVRLDEVRQRVLLDMRFNLGPTGYRSFTRTLALVEQGDYVSAADQMLKSKWAKQVGRRARTLAQMMRTGVDR